MPRWPKSTANQPPRVKGIQIHRPFVYGSLATPFPPNTPRPPSIPPEHTHRWTVYLSPLTPSHPLTPWLKKVQFKLHETYANSTRMIESPGPFEITETGWGEFEVQIKLFFVPEAGEKSQTLWHALKLHPYGVEGSEERVRMERGGEVRSECYEEVVFSEPVEGFLEVLTTPAEGRGKAGGGAGGGAGKGKKAGGVAGVDRGAELPVRDAPGVVYSQEKEQAQMVLLKEAGRTVEALMKVEKEKLREREQRREELGREGGGGQEGEGK